MGLAMVDDEQENETDDARAVEPPQAGPFRVEPTEQDVGRRIDAVLAARVPGVSRARLTELIKAGALKDASGKAITQPSLKVVAGAHYVVEMPEMRPLDLEPEKMALVIVHEDDELIVIDKPAGLVVHPGAGHRTGTLVNGLLHHCKGSLSGIGGVERPGIVHRLDKDTSGLLVVAKTDRAHQSLSEQFAIHGRDGRLVRRYKALVWGHMEKPQVTVNAHLGRHKSDRTKMAVVSPGQVDAREAISHFSRVELLGPPMTMGRAMKQGPRMTLVDVALETGRTHQIRVHANWIKHPVVGDQVYGAHHSASALGLKPEAREALEALGRQALHAAVLGFAHPVRGKKMMFESALPDDLARLVRAMG
jgi:23S rRNA pseudouridine1911/1915/1917 synthase